MSEEERPTAVIPPSPTDLVAVDIGDEDSLLGTTLHDSYLVSRFLAEGGMGRVYEAQHTRITTKRFAIKVLHAGLKHSIDVRMRFRREAEAAAAVNHPNVVGVHDFGYTPDGRPYLVSEFLEGEELYALLAGGKTIPVGLATSIACQMCRALEAAHDKGVIHRDLKPANVFLIGPRDAPEVKVLDFGLSKILELSDATDTQTGTVMGTPSYMSPEQAKGERADHRADVYGVGAVLYACLTGRPPFDEDSPHQTVLAVMTREPVRPCLINPSVPPELEVVVQKAMAHAPGDRYASMRDLAAALAPFANESLLARRGSLPSAPTAPTPAQVLGAAAEARGVRRRALAWLVLAALLLLAGGLSAAIGAFPLVSRARLSSTELLLIRSRSWVRCSRPACCCSCSCGGASGTTARGWWSWSRGCARP
ncbi:MAG: serine/threonine-protein kinase [Polyangiaceae bacterium]